MTKAILCAASLLLVTSSCMTARGSRDEAKSQTTKAAQSKAPRKNPNSIESFALWDAGTRVDAYVLKRGAKARGTSTASGY